MSTKGTVAEQARKWATLAAQAASTKTDSETVILSVGDLLAITDLFVVTSARNARQVKALVDEIEHHISSHDGPRPLRVEGLDDLRWVLMDYGAFVVHVFVEESRRFYDLERLWSDASRLEWSADTDA